MKRKAEDVSNEDAVNGKGAGREDGGGDGVKVKRRAISNDDEVRAAFREGLFEDGEREKLRREYSASEPCVEDPL